MTSHVSSISESLDLCMPVCEQFGANMIHVCTYGCFVRNPLNLKCHSGMAFWPRRSDWVILLSRISCCVVCSNGAETDTECYRRSPLNALLHSFTECRALFSRGRLGTLTFWPRLGKSRLALRVPTLQVTIDWVITGSNSELVLWENPSWYHFYWAIWMNYVDWNPICPLDWIGFYDNLENNLFQNWSSKYSRMYGSF